MNNLCVDIGSSTVKVYEIGKSREVKLLGTKSIHFKNDFSPEMGITEVNKQTLYDYINTFVYKYSGAHIRVYATAIFRKLSPDALKMMQDDFYKKTTLYLNVVSHELENFYLERALSNGYNLDEPLLLMNIGGGSTELIIIKSDVVLERHNLDVGVMRVLSDFPLINEQFSKHKLDEVVSDIIARLPSKNVNPSYAVYNGGELTYMQLAGYPLEGNTAFKDKEHPYSISSKAFAAKNAEIFNSISLASLERLMPQDPLWMHGARACSAIAQAVTEHYGVERIVPSDSNMVHGIVNQELRTVVLSGSFRKHLDYILEVKKTLTDRRIKVLSPRFETPKNPGEEFVTFDGEQGLSPLELERFHLDMIDKSDALIVCCKDGYVGSSAMIEIGYAQALNKRIIFTKKPTEFMLQTLPAEVGI